MAKTWFFKTKSGEIFGVDDENKAWNYYGGNNIKQRLPYIGWSDGKTHLKYIKQAKDKIMEDEIEYNQMLAELEEEIKATRDLKQRKVLKEEKRIIVKQIIALYDKEKNLIKKGQEKEIEAAQNNPDKTPPRNMDFRSYNTKQPLNEVQQAMLGNIKF